MGQKREHAAWTYRVQAIKSDATATVHNVHRILEDGGEQFVATCWLRSDAERIAGLLNDNNGPDEGDLLTVAKRLESILSPIISSGAMAEDIAVEAQAELPALRAAIMKLR